MTWDGGRGKILNPYQWDFIRSGIRPSPTPQAIRLGATTMSAAGSPTGYLFMQSAWKSIPNKSCHCYFAGLTLSHLQLDTYILTRTVVPMDETSLQGCSRTVIESAIPFLPLPPLSILRTLPHLCWSALLLPFTSTVFLSFHVHDAHSCLLHSYGFKHSHRTVPPYSALDGENWAHWVVVG